MTDDRSDETRADTVRDREIEALLAVDPSPEFLARVRVRVAAEPEPGRWRFGWWSLAAGAAAVGAILVAVAVLRPGQPEERDARVADVAPVADAVVSPPTVTSPPASEDAVVAAPPMPAPEPILADPVVTAPPPEPPPVSVPAAPVGTGSPAFARVVISESEAAALRQLYTQISNGRLVVPAAAARVVPAAPPEPPAEITIPPVIIEPVTLALIEGDIE